MEKIKKICMKTIGICWKGGRVTNNYLLREKYNTLNLLKIDNID